MRASGGSVILSLAQLLACGGMTPLSGGATRTRQFVGPAGGVSLLAAIMQDPAVGTSRFPTPAHAGREKRLPPDENHRPYVQTGLMGEHQASDPRAMPLEE